MLKVSITNFGIRLQFINYSLIGTLHNNGYFLKIKLEYLILTIKFSKTVPEHVILESQTHRGWVCDRLRD